MKETSYAFDLLQKGKRADDREFEDFRKLELQTGIINTAEGSARVKLGDTEIIAGVKMNVGTPFPDTPNEGILIVNAEFTPLASPDFESGPPSEDAVECARVVDRGIRESHCIEMEKLAIDPEKVWAVFVDIHIINHGGNLIDAAAIAAVAALHNAQIPKYDGEKITRGEYQAKLPVVHKPVTVTVCKLGEKLFVDPTLEEEQIVDSKLSIAFREDDYICALQKQSAGSINFEEIKKFIEVAEKKSKDLRKKIWE